MKRPGEILLISCYELGHQPLGIASPMGFLERAGYSPAALDVSRAPLLPEAIRRARLAGISVPMHTALRLGIAVAERIRELNPSCHLCFYGPYAHFLAPYLLERHAESVLSGEIEESLVGLARALESGREPADVPGLALRGRPAAPVLERLRFAAPSRRGLPPLTSYAALEAEGGTRTAGYTEASRGCGHLCRHCPLPPVYGGRFFIVPRETVLADIRAQVRAGAAHLTFGDADFLNGPGHALALVREMHRELPRLTFDFTAKIEHLLEHRGLLGEMASLGCLFIVSAVESLNDRVLEILDKGHTRADVTEALAAVRGAGITLRPSLVPFTPWSSLADYGELLDFVETEDLVEAVDPVQLAIRLLLPPGSLLLSEPSLAPFLGPLEPGSLSYRWTHPDPRMDRLHQEVTALVEEAAHRRTDSSAVFHRIRERHAALAGGTVPRELFPPPATAPRRSLPRLTESWFC